MYDVLWKFSRMSEYIEVREKPVSLWLTLGNPLGEPSVQNELYDADEREDGKFPTNVHRWSNITAHDDIIAHDATIEDDFREMTRREFIEEGNIRELPRIYNFWVRNKRSNPHKFYGYLNHPEFAQALVDWIKR